MAQESEKRFHQIMDSLFSSPDPKNPSPSSQSGEGASSCKKRMHPSSALALVEPSTGIEFRHKYQRSSSFLGSSDAPLCRPWDRGDLMKRLATFKSMTWFAMPQVISALNCARRGWVNIDIDTIACESCGVRLLFSTPASWSQQQVEKAASVFSLKLDNGHKLLCPWLNNYCDEQLVEFPPMLPQDLADKFMERSYALSLLLALPVVSPSAIEYMRCSELEEFLEQPLINEHGDMALGTSQSESTGSEQDSCSVKLYYQAQKLICLCGWEPRSLPYVVECKEKSSQLCTTDTNVTDLLQESTKSEILFACPSDASKTIEMDDNARALDDAKYDPKSVVLDCKLCGASVGLWVFPTVPRPLEFLRLVGLTEANTKRRSGESSSGNVVHSDKDQRSNLSLTIAGGPPATKQNFKATISLPVIGRSLRNRISWDFELKKSISRNQKAAHLTSLDLLDKEGDAQTPGMIDEPNSTLDNRTAENGTSCAELDINNANNVSELPSESGRNGCDAESLKENALSEHEQAKKNGSVCLLVEDADNKRDGDASVVSGNSRINSELSNQRSVAQSCKDSWSIKSKSTTVGSLSMPSETGKEMKFDPIRQHRHFCPWIMSTGKKKPGWQQTLSALCRQKEAPRISPSSGSLFKVEDPITSVRNLFKSPVAKKMKDNKESS